MHKLLNSITQSLLWGLKRYDYYINKSVASINNPNHYQNPYLAYNTIRGRGRILPSAANRGWIVTGFNEVQILLQHKNISSDIRSNQFFVRLLKFATGNIEVSLIDNPTMLNLDAPDHTRLRRLVLTGFTHKYVQSLQPMIDNLVKELLDATRINSKQTFELNERLAGPLPAIVIAEMLGVPVADRHKFEHWSEQLIGLTEISQPSMIKQAAIANNEMRQYIADLTEQKRDQKDSNTDLISSLLRAESEGDKLNLDELYSTCVLLLTAGHETTSRLIGNCIYHLIQHPKQLQAVRDNPELIDLALEETLRFEPPIQNTIRFVKSDMVFEGHKFKRGQLLLLCIAGANRDPLANENPDEFNIYRENSKHISFGHGIHLCLGASLARIEAKSAILELLTRYPKLSLSDEKPQWGSNDFFRGLRKIPLKLN